MRWLVAGLIILGSGMPACAEAPLSLSRLIAFLAGQGVAVETGRIGRVAVDAVLRHVDPGAVLVSGDATNRLPVAGACHSESWLHGIGYVRMTSLTPETAVKTADFMAGLQRPAGHILDLRQAGGDSLEAVERVAGSMVPVGSPLFSVVDERIGVTNLHVSPGPEPAVRVPFMVLVDNQTRNGAEILARILKGRPDVFVIGTTTRGEAAIRQWIPVQTNWHAWIRSVRVQAPAGMMDWPAQVDPDIVSPRSGAESIAAPPVPDTDDSERPISEQARQDRELMRRVSGDPPLARATDILLGLAAVRPVDHEYATSHSNERPR